MAEIGRSACAIAFNGTFMVVPGDCVRGRWGGEKRLSEGVLSTGVYGRDLRDSGEFDTDGTYIVTGGEAVER